MLSSAPTLAPERIGRYQLIERLAVGGMAEIFLARVSGLEGFEKLVVVKRVLPELDVDANFLAMFLDEARLAALLSHPNIAEVYDIGYDEGSYFFAMEFVHGKNLNQLLTSLARTPARRMPIGQAVAIAIGAAAGLHHAHEKVDLGGRPLSIVHRDVSPSNIVVRYDGCVKVVDFGIAKAASQHETTRVGTIKGKFAYMSPEQCRGRPIDRRSDIFSLGIVLYEMTTGRRLFRGATDKDVVRQIALGKPPAPSRLVPDYPPALEHIVLRALARERDERYSSAEELQLALEDFALRARVSVSQVGVARLMEQLYPAQRKLPAMLDVATDEEAIEPTTEVEDEAQHQGQGDDEVDTDVEMIAIAESGPIQLTLPPAPSDERAQAPVAQPPVPAANASLPPAAAPVTAAPAPVPGAGPHPVGPRPPLLTLRSIRPFDSSDRTARVASLQPPLAPRRPGASWAWLLACVALAALGAAAMWAAFRLGG